MARMLRKVARGRQQVVGKRAGEQLAVLVVEEVLEKRAAQALHDGADALAVQRQRIDDAADVLDRDIIDQLDLSGLGIDRHIGGVRAIRIGPLVARESAVGAKPGEFFQVDGGAAGPDRHAAIDARFRRSRSRAARAAAARMSSRSLLAASTIALPPITMERDENEP